MNSQKTKALEAVLAHLGQTGKFNIAKVDAEALKLKQSLDLVRRSGKFNVDIKPPNVSGWGKLTAGIGAATKSLLAMAGPLGIVLSLAAMAQKL